MKTVMVHILNEEPIVGELEDLPTIDSQIVYVNNPRRKDGKDLIFLDEGVSTIIFPWHRINFIQVLPSAGEDDVIGFVRE